EIWQIGGSTTTQTVSETSATFTGLSSRTTYFLSVRALNGDGVLTTASPVISTATPGLSAPASLSAAALGVSSITWSWPDVTDKDGFRVVSSTGGNISGDLSPNTLAWTETGLSTNTATSRRVVVFFTSLVSTSPLAAAYTLAATPTSFALAGVHFTSMTVVWAANTNPAGTTTYRAEIWQIGGATTTQTLSITSATFTGLSAATTYYLSVRPANGDGVLSAPAGPLTAATFSNAPAAFAAAAQGVSSITWTWNGVSGAIRYNFYPSTGGTAIAVAANSLTLVKLSTNTAYSGRVSATNSSGEGLLSSAATAYTLAAPPTGFALVEVHFTSVTVSWAANTNPAGTTTYRAEIWKSGSAATAQTVSWTSATFSNLTGGGTYFMTVGALSGGGELSASGITLSTVTQRQLSTQTVVNSGGAGSVNFVPPTGRIELNLPPGSFQETVTLTLEIPSDFPSAPSAAGRLQGTRVGIEITADKPLQPAQIATLSISYRDADVAGLDENKLILARYDAGASLWVPLVSVPDTAQNKVTGRTDHFSLFQVMQSSPALTVLNPKIFPNPLRPALGHGEMKFADLPAGASIRIYTVAGELVQELQSNAAGIASWNGRNRSGEKAASGVYFVFIEKDGERKTFKAAVQR
ncbi:MAG: fibronectin type III domain-containing protein, partial [Elusimicrobia bacterium]|nr:fibronectin type III domain-containing protein [Elusimicrobiota bacterium]